MSSPERKAESSATREGDDNGSAEPPLKRTCITISEEPDVKIIVGGEVFYEHQQTLRCISVYFDAMFRSDMKEAQTSTIMLLDKDPREWELFMSTVVPCAKVQVNILNVKTLLPWYDFFQISSMMDRCDDLCNRKWFGLWSSARLCKKYGDRFLNVRIGDLSAEQTASMKADLQKWLDRLEMAQRYRLVKSKKKACLHLGRVVADSPDILEEEDVRRIVTLLQDKDCRAELWPMIKQYLPEKYREKKDDDSFFKNDLFFALLQSQIKARIELANADKRLDDENIKLQSLVRDALRWPDRLGNSLPQRKSLGPSYNENIDSVCRDLLKDMIANDRHWEDRGAGRLDNLLNWITAHYPVVYVCRTTNPT